MDTTEVKQLAKEHGLEMEESSIVMNDSGVDFLAAFARDRKGQKWILRIPRRASSMRAAQVEKDLLDALKRQLSADVPEWEVFTERLIAYRELPGPPGSVAELGQSPGYLACEERTQARRSPSGSCARQ